MIKSLPVQWIDRYVIYYCMKIYAYFLQLRSTYR